LVPAFSFGCSASTPPAFKSNAKKNTKKSDKRTTLGYYGAGAARRGSGGKYPYFIVFQGFIQGFWGLECW